MKGLEWSDIWPIVNSFILLIAIPIIAGIRQTRKEDLTAIYKEFERIEDKLDELDKRVRNHHEHHPGGK